MSTYSMSKILFTTLVTTSAASVNAQHEHSDHLEEIIVTSSQNKSRAETALPVTILSGESLRKSASSTIGDTIKSEPGVNSSTFGTGVGQPIIRGLAGNRVSVLENSLSTLDASGASPDHASAVEPLIAERIEIVKGPATLLYGNNAIGGVVNVIDSRIPGERIESLTGAVEVRGTSVDDGSAVVGKLQGGKGQFAWHLDGMQRSSDDMDVPGDAIAEGALDDDEFEEQNTNGFLANSDTEADSYTIGGSWIGEDTVIGFSFNESNNEYGLPPGAHAHEHEEHEEEEEEEGEEHHEEEGEFVRIDLEQRRTDFKLQHRLNDTFNNLTLLVRKSDYQHIELEGVEEGTRFINDGIETRFTANHAFSGDWNGIWGIEYKNSEFSAVGEEAFIPATDVESYGIFALETINFDTTIVEFGLRADHFALSPQASSACSASDTSVSASASIIAPLTDDIKWLVGFSHAQRAGSIEERYSNIDPVTCMRLENPVEHLATARIEFGDADLGNESSNNIELGLLKTIGVWQFEVNAFYNQFDDYIYLEDIGTADELLISDEEIIVSEYKQADADFYGFEGQATAPLFDHGDHHLDITLLADWVYAELDNGEYVSRLPPASVGLTFDYIFSNWSMQLSSRWHSEQDKLAVNETKTDGYTLVDLSMDYHLPVGSSELLLFFAANNLTDEEVRDHTSFLKDFAPGPGRGYSLGARLSF
ncbi:TonB-dependent receptor [Aurantivibrio plasticivorans]